MCDITARGPCKTLRTTPVIMPSSSSRKARARHRGSSIGIVDAKEAVDLATAQTYSENVFLFVPNLIGENERRRSFL